jgi:hypothetical protein
MAKEYENKKISTRMQDTLLELKQKPLGLYQENKYIFINYTMEWKV